MATARDTAITAMDAYASDTAQTQHTTDQTSIDTLNATITALRAQLAAQRPPSSLVGAHVAGASYADAVALLGPLPVTRVFCPGALPADFATAAKGVPAGTVLVVSYKTPQTNLAAFVKSAPPGLLRMIHHHEPENDFNGKGADFVAQFSAEYKTSKAAAHDVPFGMAAMTYQYTAGRHGCDGSFLPPPADTDFYYCDNYVSPGAPPLASDPEFQGWYTLVKDRGRPLGLAEYGVGTLTDKSATPKVRAATMAADTQWLLTHPQFGLLMYWWSDRGDWRFTDAVSVAAWKQMTAALA